MNVSGTDFRRIVLLTAVASALGFVCLTVPAEADDVLRFRVTSLGGRTYGYWQFSNASLTVQSGDYIEYDVCLHVSAPGVGGIEIYNTDGTYWRDQPGWADQNGTTGHPTADLSSAAYGKWYHRKLAVPPSMVGKTISLWDVAVDGTYGVYDVRAAMYNNVCITRGGSVVAYAYQDGSPSLNVGHFSTSTVQSAQLFPTSPRREPVQTAAHLFYWHDAPNGNADPSQMVYDPHGVSNTGPWSGYGSGHGYSGYYSSMNTAWWEGELQDMKCAGVDIADLICWGNHPFPWFQMSVLSNYLVPALERSGVGIKIALFDDTTSECCEWNNDNGRGYGVSPQMPLSDTANWTYFYDRKIKPFFQAIPQKYWATHNGDSVDAGGRPIIITYSSGWFTGVNTHGTALWQEIKNSFARDFKNSSGQGITPFVVHEQSWVHKRTWPWEEDYDSSADASYKWGSALNGPTINSLYSYNTGTIGPGYDDRIIRSPGSYHARDNGNWLISWYNGSYGGRKLWDCNLVLWETWNELWEGTALDRCVDYPNTNGGVLPETQYIDKMRSLVASSIGLRDYDATFLRTWQIPSSVCRGSTQVTITVRNDGQMQWGDTTHMGIGAWLEDTTTGAEIPGTRRDLIHIPTAMGPGQEATLAWTVPADWPTGTYDLRLDMVWDSSFWFNSKGDTPVKRPITISCGAISGTIKDSSSNPLAGATVSTDTGGYQTTTATDGKYTLLDVGEGTYNVTASKSGYYSQTAHNVPVSTGQTITINLYLVPLPGAISGSARDSYGGALDGATVSTNTGGYSTTTASNGTYTLSNVKAGTYDVTASKSGYYAQTGHGVSVFSNQTTTCNLYLAPISVSVTRIQDAKALADGTWVIITQQKTVTCGSSTFIDGCSYIEEPDRTSGIKLTPRSGVAAVNLGDTITLTGIMRTGANGERYIEVASIGQ